MDIIYLGLGVVLVLLTAGAAWGCAKLAGRRA
jgi:hypothetical protein